MIYKKIFSKHVRVDLNIDKKTATIIKNELKYYPNSLSSKPDIEIEITYFNESNMPTVNVRNPKIVMEAKNAIIFDYGSYYVMWNPQSTPLKATLFIKKIPGLKRMYTKFRSIQFLSIEESVGQILHENILVPLSYFFNDIAPIHGSCISNKNGNSVIIGGTGGSGKSSTLLSFIDSDSYFFVSDDIAIINSAGNIFPNYALPKIYAYNTKDDKNLESRILKNRSLIDKIMWHIRKGKNPSRVRRRVYIEKLWNIDKKASFDMKYYLILYRGNFNDITLEKISATDAVEASLNIIFTEYWNFNTKIMWHKFNSIFYKRTPFVSIESVYNNWKKIYENAMKKCKNYLVKVPTNMPNDVFKVKIKEIIMDLLENRM